MINYKLVKLLKEAGIVLRRSGHPGLHSVLSLNVDSIDSCDE